MGQSTSTAHVDADTEEIQNKRQKKPKKNRNIPQRNPAQKSTEPVRYRPRETDPLLPPKASLPSLASHTKQNRASLTKPRVFGPHTHYAGDFVGQRSLSLEAHVEGNSANQSQESPDIRYAISPSTEAGTSPEIKRVATEFSQDVISISMQRRHRSERGKLIVKELRELKKDIPQAKMQLISLGSAIGTGLFLALGGALATGGPLGSLIGYGLAAIVLFAVQSALCEVSALYPVKGGLLQHSKILIDPALEYVLGWNKLLGVMISVACYISTVLVLLQVSFDSGWMPYFIAMMMIATLVFGTSSSKTSAHFGIITTSVTPLKIVLFTLVIGMGFLADLGWWPTIQPYGFRYWKHPGVFGSFEHTHADYLPQWLGKFVGVWAVFYIAVYSFAGVEDLVIASAKEKVESPRQSIPKTCQKVFHHTVLFYLLTTFAVGLVIPSNDPYLYNPFDTVTRSPLVIVASRLSPYFICINFLVIALVGSTAFSAIRSGLRLADYLVEGDCAYPSFGPTTCAGRPCIAIVIQTCVSGLSLLALWHGPLTVFYWLVHFIASQTLISWIFILVNQLRLRQACKAQGIDDDELPAYSIWWTPTLSYIAIGACVLLLFMCGLINFLPGHKNHRVLFAAYIDIPFVIALWWRRKCTRESEIVDLHEIPISDLLDDLQKHPEPVLPRISMSKVLWTS